jgi:hypothetical protein
LCDALKWGLAESIDEKNKKFAYNIVEGAGFELETDNLC